MQKIRRVTEQLFATPLHGLLSAYCLLPSGFWLLGPFFSGLMVGQALEGLAVGLGGFGGGLGLIGFEAGLGGADKGLLVA